MSIKNKEILIYGIGRIQKDFEYMFPNFKIKGYIIEDKEKNRQIDMPIYYLSKLNKSIIKNKKIVICHRKNNEIYEKLLKLGLKERKDYYWVEDLGYLLDNKYDELVENIIQFYLRHIKRWGKYKTDYISNSKLFKKMIYTDSYDGFLCKMPFEYINIQYDGFVYSCCPAYSYSKLGNLVFKKFENIWNSTTRRLYKLSIINKTYAFCDKNLCPYLSKNLEKSNERFENIEEKNYPQQVYVSIDRSCNLKCKSCRKEFYNAKGLNLIYTKLLSKRITKYKNINKAKKLVVAGQGEVFFSKVYQDMIFKSNLKHRDSIEIFTNGTLLNKEKLDKLCEIYTKIKIYITVDAVNKSTYNKLRFGGNFDNLMKNLEYISYMRKKEKIKEVQLFFVVQRDNYKEMIDLVKLAQKLKFDGINFSQISNWGTFSNKEFKRISMFDENGMPKIELKKVLKNKVFKEEIVKYSQINKFF